MLISGHIIVRKPIWNYDFLKRIPPFEPRILPCGLVYRGMDRFPWYDISEAYFDNFLDDDIAKINKNLDDWEYHWLCCIQDIHVAKKVCDFSNVFAQIKYESFIANSSCINEIIAVYSPYLHENCGLTSFSADEQYSLLGYDAIAIGEWSLIYGGLFDGVQHNIEKGLCIVKWYSNLNKNGLFNTIEEAKIVERALAELQS